MDTQKKYHRQQAYQNRRMAKGLCVVCGLKRDGLSTRHCERCKVLVNRRQAESMRRLRLWRKDVRYEDSQGL